MTFYNDIHNAAGFLYGTYSRRDRFTTRVNSYIGTTTVVPNSIDWSGENNWWCPSPWLVPRVVSHAEACGVSGTLLVPCWESAPFWPLLYPSGEGFASFVVEYY